MPAQRLVLAFLLLAAPQIQAQSEDKPQPPAPEIDHPRPAQEGFLLSLTLKVSDQNKIVTNQTYTMTGANSGLSPSVRDGDRVPVSTDAGGGVSHFQYVDVGTNIDIFDIRKTGSILSMGVKVENSSAIGDTSGKGEPVIRQTRYAISPAIPLNRTVTVYSSTDAVTGRKVEIQLRAEPMSQK